MTRDSLVVASVAARRIPVLDPYELAGGKLSALFSRNASRDLFDTHALLRRGGLEIGRLRQAFVLYGAMNRRDRCMQHRGRSLVRSGCPLDLHAAAYHRVRAEACEEPP